MAQSGRQLSASDATNVGQCLSGDFNYGKDYCTTDTHVLLRITLDDGDLSTLVKDSATHAAFSTMQEAVDATECTSIAVIPPGKIEYSIEGGNGWEPIASYKKPAPKNWSDD